MTTIAHANRVRIVCESCTAQLPIFVNPFHPVDADALLCVNASMMRSASDEVRTDGKTSNHFDAGTPTVLNGQMYFIHIFLMNYLHKLSGLHHGFRCEHILGLFKIQA